MYTVSFTTLRSALDNKEKRRRKNTIKREVKGKISEAKRTQTLPTSEAMLSKKHKGPASLFGREAEVSVGALKTKSCLSEASSFCLAETLAGVAQKVQTANFLCFVSFVRAKEMKSLRGLSESKAFKPLRQLSNSEAPKPSGN